MVICALPLKGSTVKASRNARGPKRSREVSPPGVSRHRPAKPNARGSSTREVILTAAARYFSEHGYRGTSTAAIAAAADLSEPGLLHHFGSKNGLLMALLEMRYAFDEQKFLADRELEGLSLLPLLLALVEENVRQPESLRLTMVILAESISKSHPAHDYFKQRYARARGILERHLEDARRQGFLRRDVATPGLAAVLLAAMDGLQLQWLLDPSVDMVESFAVLMRVLAAALPGR
jgi:AcrR family transcriptional regulator